MNVDSFEEYQSFLRNNPIKENCPVDYVLDLFQSKWNVRVLYELTKADTIRFGALKRLIPRITNAVLSLTLKNLEQKGLVHRRQFDEVPLRVEYSLSEKGKSMYPIFVSMYNWGMAYREKD